MIRWRKGSKDGEDDLVTGCRVYFYHRCATKGRREGNCTKVWIADLESHLGSSLRRTVKYKSYTWSIILHYTTRWPESPVQKPEPETIPSAPD